MSGWRLGSLTAEAFRNIAAAWPRTVILFLAAGGLVGVVTWSELDGTEGILAFQRELVAAGAHVYIAEHEGGIDRAACHGLSERTDVSASGSMSLVGTLQTNVAPGTLFQGAEITSGMLSVWGTNLREADLAGRVVLGRAAAAELGLQDGMSLGLDTESPLLTLVADVERRGTQASRWILKLVAPSGTSTSCWIEMRPGAASYGQTLLDHVYASRGPDLSVRPLIRLDEFARDPSTELITRPQGRAWVIGGVLLTLVNSLALWFRRGELSLYRVMGTSRPGLWFLTQVEVIAILIVAGLASYLWAATSYSAFSGINPTLEQHLIAARTTASTLAVPAIVAPTFAVLVGARGGLLNQLKEG